ncbi:TPA: TetR/AcrR family transcriptional regulator [Photobacterium damselae]|uniref:TetR/AcrR family transcriptional regulator n=1 Tax=Photobacterium damselae TaxID=38293 RepID=UPI001EDEFE95|nr:TetR/AcrR family transcriptional regulator [Photobacterium damselae]MCG3826323.1 TetR/AcrR family transcriptional regulator [Photobacterium damselae]
MSTKKVLTPRSQRKREQILAAASELFMSQGYMTSMDLIAEQAGVSKQTVYSHFKTKDDLFDTCIRAKCVAAEFTETALDHSLPIREFLCQFAYRFQAMLLSTEAVLMFRTAISQIDNHPDLAKTYLAAGPEATVILLVQFLELKQQQGVIAIPGNMTLEQAAMQLLLMWHGKAVYWRYLGQETQELETELHHYLDACVDLFLAGYQVDN